VQEHVNLPIPGSDTREPDVQGQIDGLRSALRDWQRTREYSQPTQKRLEQLTVQCAQLVDLWQQMHRRRNGGSAAEPGGNGTGALGTLHQGTGERIRALERAIEQEWESLPSVVADPTGQINEQALSLVENCVTSTNLALRGFASAESRVSALEREIQAGMTQLSRDLQSVLIELRSLRASGLPAPPPAFPLEGVMRIHQELRDSTEDPDASGTVVDVPPAAAPAAGPLAIEAPAPVPSGSEPAVALPSASAPEPSEPAIEAPPTAAAVASKSPIETPRAAGPIASGPAIETPPAPASPVPEPAAALSARVESLERAVEDVAQRESVPRNAWRPWYVAAGVLVIVGAIALVGLWLQRRVDVRLNDAALRVSAAERERDAAIDATRQDAARQVADARQSAAQAQIVGNVLAAPDLVRYWLRGATPDSPAYGHVLFSRSRGLVFSASRLAPADAGKTYQLWLSTGTGPISAGLVNPDTEGRVTLATAVPLAVMGRLAGAFLTLEPDGGRTEPSSQVVLVRVE
jgi:hypothetical protein